MSKTLEESAASVLGGNVSSKQSAGEKRETVPGKRVELNAKPVVKGDEKDGPDATKGAKGEDKSKPKKGAGAAEKIKKIMKAKGSPKQEDLELEEDDVIAEEEVSEEDDQVTEEEEVSEEDEVTEDDDVTEENDDDDDSDDDDDEDDSDDKKKDKKDDVDEEDEVVEEDTLPTIDDVELDLSEDIEAMFAGADDLSEEFKERVTNVFEAAVRTQVKKYEDALTEAYEETLSEVIDEMQEALEDDVSKYLDYVTEEWMEENRVAVETGLRNELSEDFINGLHNLFLEHYIDVPEDKVDVIAEMSEKLSDLEESLDEQIKKNVELTENLSDVAKALVLDEACEGLVDTQAEKLRELAEDLSYDEGFENKLSDLKESYFKTAPKKKPQQLDEEVIDNPEKGVVQEEVEGNMGKYVQALTHQTRNL